MINMRLSDFKKKSNKYFQNLGNIQNTSRKITDYITHKSYEALPKKLKEFLEPDRRQIIKITSNLVDVSGEEGIDVYKALKAQAQQRYNRVYTPQKKLIWDQFKKVEKQVYNHYNTYMYRLGYSASKYWFENVEFSSLDKTMVTTILTLPEKLTGEVKYSILEIIYDYSDFYIEALMY